MYFFHHLQNYILLLFLHPIYTLKIKKGFTTAQYKMQIKNVEKLFLSRNIGFSVWIYSRLDRSSCIGSEWGKNVDSYHLLLHFLIFQSGLYLSTPDKILLFILSLCEYVHFFSLRLLHICITYVIYLLLLDFLKKTLFYIKCTFWHFENEHWIQIYLDCFSFSAVHILKINSSYNAWWELVQNNNGLKFEKKLNLEKSHWSLPLQSLKSIEKLSKIKCYFSIYIPSPH